MPFLSYNCDPCPAGNTFDDTELWPYRNGAAPWIGEGTAAAWTAPQFADIDNDGDYDLLLCGEVATPELCESTESQSI